MFATVVAPALSVPRVAGSELDAGFAVLGVAAAGAGIAAATAAAAVARRGIRMEQHHCVAWWYGSCHGGWSAHVWRCAASARAINVSGACVSAESQELCPISAAAGCD